MWCRTTWYAKSGEVNIAYQVFGDGPVDLVFVPGFISHIELAWEEPYLARFLRRLAAFTRVIFFDKRGTGLSDPVSRPPGLAERMDDIRAVMDAAGSQRAALFGVSDGGCLCIAFAVAHPERSASLVTYGSVRPPAALRRLPVGLVCRASGGGPARDGSGLGQREVVGRGQSQRGRRRALPGMVGTLPAGRRQPLDGRGALGLNAELDIRHLLAQVAVPTLVIHRTNEQWVDVGNSRYPAAHISVASAMTFSVSSASTRSSSDHPGRRWSSATTWPPGFMLRRWRSGAWPRALSESTKSPAGSIVCTETRRLREMRGGGNRRRPACKARRSPRSRRVCREAPGGPSQERSGGKRRPECARDLASLPRPVHGTAPPP